MKPDGAHFASLCAELEEAAAELLGPLERDPARWVRGRPGKWTAGQHVEHVAIFLEWYLRGLDASARRLDRGALPRPGMRWPPHALVAGLILGRGWFPRGVKTRPEWEATARPDMEATLARLRRDLVALRAFGEGRSPAGLDRLWFKNPLFGRLTLPEAVRAQAVHLRHHARLVAEMAGGAG